MLTPWICKFLALDRFEERVDLQIQILAKSCDIVQNRSRIWIANLNLQIRPGCLVTAIKDLLLDNQNALQISDVNIVIMMSKGYDFRYWIIKMHYK